MGTVKYWPEKFFDGHDCYPWRLTRAWLPVKTIGGQYVWLRQVYKRKYWSVWGSFHMEPVVEYATLFEVIACKDY